MRKEDNQIKNSKLGVWVDPGILPFSPQKDTDGYGPLRNRVTKPQTGINWVKTGTDNNWCFMVLHMVCQCIR